MRAEQSTLTRKQRFPREHLGEDAASCPHVDGFCVVVGGQQQPGRSVPFGDQALRQMTLNGGETL